jgi:hypothetical protein
VDSFWEVSAEGLEDSFSAHAVREKGVKTFILSSEKDDAGSLSYSEANFGVRTAGLAHAEIVLHSKTI